MVHGNCRGNDFTTQSIQKIKQIFGRLCAYGNENELISANLNPVRAGNIKGIGKKVGASHRCSTEIAWKIAMALPIQHRTLVLLAAGTGLRISECVPRTPVGRY